MTEPHVIFFHEDGLISIKEADSIENKTVSQILDTFHFEDPTIFILGYSTGTTVEILSPDIIPLRIYPGLKTRKPPESNLFPDIALCILNKSETKKEYFVIYPSLSTDEKITFPPLFYGFDSDSYNLSITDMIKKIVRYFNLLIADPKLYLNDEEIPTEDSSFTCLNFIQKVNNSKNSKIHLKFNYMKSIDKGILQYSRRQQLIKDMVTEEMIFARDLALLLNLIGENVQKKRIFTESQFECIFGPIPDMLNASARFTTAITDKVTYSAVISDAILRQIPDLQENFKEFFANYFELIPDTIERHKNDVELQGIIQNTFEKEDSTFQSVTILPIQHFPRYQLFVKELLECTPKSHPDFHPFQTILVELFRVVNELNDYHMFRDVLKLEKKLVPLNENENDPIKIDGRYLLKKFVVNQTKLSKNYLYVLNDLILLTSPSGNGSKELERLRCRYDELIFFVNPKNFSISIFHENQLKSIKFSSYETLEEMMKILNECRKEAFNNNIEKKWSLMATEYLPTKNQIMPLMIDSSSCKIGNLINAASYSVYITFDIRNNELNVIKNIKNIHSHAKLVKVDNVHIPFIYGGEKYPSVLEFFDNRFTENKPQPNKSTSSSDVALNNLVPMPAPKEGRVHHTCCSYKQYIVIYGGYKEMNLKNQKKKYFPEIFFYNVQTDEWFTNKSDHVNEPDPRYKHSAVVYKNLMIIHGGVSAITEAILNDTWCFNFNDGKWSLINNDSKIFVSRFEHAAVMVKQFMFVIGGMTYNTKTNKIQDQEKFIVGEEEDQDPNSSINPDEIILEEEESDESYNEENNNSSNEPQTSSNNNKENENLESTNDNNNNVNVNVNENINLEDFVFVDSSDVLNSSMLLEDENLVAAPSCFCINIETGKLYKLNIIGNFLPGRSLSSAVYDDDNNRIILFGGSYRSVKLDCGSPVTYLTIPQVFISSEPKEGDIDVSQIASPKPKVSRMSSQSVFTVYLLPNGKDVKNDEGENNRNKGEVLNLNVEVPPATPNPKRVRFPLQDYQSNSAQTPGRRPPQRSQGNVASDQQSDDQIQAKPRLFARIFQKKRRHSDKQ
ncbi:hypothetical protein M9Y10_019627 [Tritrichomonas musculus]|uniref:DH domain-containing protein n=1 Tax=Tritrichomonas musculus TaxID=1915356 RepID=A0ABR2HIY2_9EUKA